MKKVLYVGFYDVMREGRKIRSYSLAAAKKMDFICDAITALGYNVDIVSPAYLNIKEHPKTKETRENLRPGADLVLTPSWGATTKIARIARVLYANLWLFLYLLRYGGRETPVVLYHNYALALPVLLAKKIKRFRLLLEIEERYSMVWNLTRYRKWKEDLLLRHGTEKSLIVSELLAEKMGIDDPIVSYGNYNAYRGQIPQKRQNGKNVLVYTGSIDHVKGSAFTAIEAMEYLPEEYELVISGPVVEKDKADFLTAVEEMNRKCGRKAVTYAGILDDAEYEQLLLAADAALNPQKEGGFGQYLFPSKILTYMSYGLPVVSTRGASIVRSEVADLITFADAFTGESVADALLHLHPQESEVYLERLNLLKERFLERLKSALV